MATHKTYPLTAGNWAEGGLVQVYDVNYIRLCTIPVKFMQATGDLSWHFVLYCVRACVESQGKLVYSSDTEDVNIDVDEGSSVVPGRYIYQRRGMFGMVSCTMHEPVSPFC
jgi:hypothetical protein